MIRLEVPAELRYRAVVIRTVAAACKVAREQKVGENPELDLSNEFDAQMVSALQKPSITSSSTHTLTAQ